MMSENMSGIGSRQGRTGMPRWARFAFAGGAAGLVSALVVLFVITVHYGATLGMGAEGCLIFGCAMTTMLSAPAGVTGIVAGIIVGAICGLIGHHATR